MHHGVVPKLLLLFRKKIRHRGRKINGIVCAFWCKISGCLLG